MTTENTGSPHGNRIPIHRSKVLAVSVLMATVLPLAACGRPSGSASTTTATEVPATTPPVDTTRATGMEPSTTSTSGPSVLSSITSAVVAFESRRGLPAGHYVIRGVTLSTDDPSWAKFEVDAASGYQGTVQDATGIAHHAGGWRVVGIGSSGVGCGGPHAVAAATLNDLGLMCP